MKRGKPAIVSFDNGVNFIGAAGYFELTNPQTQNSVVNNEIQLKFNPPRVPHREGLWEGAVNYYFM